MLVDKNVELKVGDIITLGIGGTEVIGGFVSQTDKEIVLSKPRMPNVDPKSGQLVGFGPILATVDHDNSLSFERSALMAKGKTSDELSKVYTQSLSKIIT